MSEKPILLICSCRKYEEYLHAAIRRMSRPEWTVVGLLGGATTTSYDPVSKILTVATPDTYECLPKKLHAAYSWIVANRPGIPGIFKTDEDLLFDVSLLVQAVLENTTRPYWGVTKAICKEAPISVARMQKQFDDISMRPMQQAAVYCYGAGYWISASALPAIVAAASDYKASVLEDVCTGYVMNRAGWIPTRIRVEWEEVPRNEELLRME